MLERINGDVNQSQSQTVNLNGPIQAPPQHDHFSLHKRIEALEEYIRKMVSRCEHMQVCCNLVKIIGLFKFILFRYKNLFSRGKVRISM